jgi:hypothetical protein
VIESSEVLKRSLEDAEAAIAAFEFRRFPSGAATPRAGSGKRVQSFDFSGADTSTDSLGSFERRTPGGAHLSKHMSMNTSPVSERKLRRQPTVGGTFIGGGDGPDAALSMDVNDLAEQVPSS